MTAPSAANPWLLTVAYSPDQNGGRVSLMPSRVPIATVVGQIVAGDHPELIADEYDLNPAQVQVLIGLALEILEVR